MGLLGIIINNTPISQRKNCIKNMQNLHKTCTWRQLQAYAGGERKIMLKAQELNTLGNVKMKENENKNENEKQVKSIINSARIEIPPLSKDDFVTFARNKSKAGYDYLMILWYNERAKRIAETRIVIRPNVFSEAELLDVYDTWEEECSMRQFMFIRGSVTNAYEEARNARRNYLKDLGKKEAEKAAEDAKKRAQVLKEKQEVSERLHERFMETIKND